MFFRCILDETVEFYTSHQPMVRFGLQAFQFIGMHEQVKLIDWIMIKQFRSQHTVQKHNAATDQSESSIPDSHDFISLSP